MKIILLTSLLVAMAGMVSSMCMNTLNEGTYLDGHFIGLGSHSIQTVNYNGQQLYQVVTTHSDGRTETRYVQPDPAGCKKTADQIWEKVVNGMPKWISQMLNRYQ